MKKTFRSIMAIAIAAMTFTACEDVPAPYDVFADEQPTDNPAVVAEGSGTQADPFNVAAAIAKCIEIGTEPSTESYYVKGIVVSGGTADATYGNVSFYIADSEDSSDRFYCFQVYGSGDKKLPAGYAVNEGDEVVVCGPIYNFRGNTPETAGKGAAYIVTINGKSTDGGSETVDAKKATIAEFNAAAESDNVWYELTGTVKNLKDGDIYGNFDLEDATGSVYVYGLLSEKGGEKKLFQELAAAKGIKNGSKITIIGTRGSYNGKIEVMNAYFVSIEGGDTPQPSGEAKGDGTLANPFNAVAATNAASALASGETSTDSYYIQGKVSTIKYQFDAEHGTATFFISEDGTANNEFQIYSTYYLDNKSWVEGDKQIAVGDDVIIYGQLTNYNGTPETASKKSYIYSLTSNGGGNDDPNPGGGDVVSGNTITVNFSSFNIENAFDITTLTLSDGTKLTFAQNDGNNSPKYYTSGSAARMYAKNSMTIDASKTINSVVLNCVATYTGNEQMYGESNGQKITPTKTNDAVTFSGVNSKSINIVNDFTETTKGTQLRIVSLTITYAE